MTEHIVPQVVNTSFQNQRGDRVIGRSLVLAAFIAASASADRPCPPELTTDGDDTTVGGAQACPLSSSLQSDTPDYQDPTATCSGLSARRTVQVASASALQQAVNTAQCGDTIQLDAGTYDASFSISKSCPAASPIVVLGAPNFASTITRSFTIGGARNIVTGIRFSGANARVDLGGENNKLLGNQFTGWRGIAISQTPGSHGEIAYNECFLPAAWDADTGTTQFRMCIRMNTDGHGQGHTVHRHAWVHHNWFHDLPPKPNPNVFSSGQSDAIEPGESNYDWTSSLQSGWYIENNLFEDLGQSQNAVIDLKVGGTVVRYNTVRGVDNGRFDIRFGSNSVVESNWLAKGGTTVHGGNHKIACNYYGAGVGIKLLAGDVEWNSGQNAHPRSRNTLVAKNRGLLRVGHQAKTSQNLPAENSTVEQHEGKLEYGLHVGTTIRQNSSVKCAEPFQIESSQVGPAAMAHAPLDYLACRIP